MPRPRSEDPTVESPDNSNRYAAAILRDMDARLDRLENAVTNEGAPNVIRADSEVLTVGDDVAVTGTTVLTTPMQWDDETAADSTWDDAGETWA